eukprot:1051598-Prorocentrum_minimum.AAC.1
MIHGSLLSTSPVWRQNLKRSRPLRPSSTTRHGTLQCMPPYRRGAQEAPMYHARLSQVNDIIQVLSTDNDMYENLSTDNDIVQNLSTDNDMPD